MSRSRRLEACAAKGARVQTPIQSRWLRYKILLGFTTAAVSRLASGLSRHLGHARPLPRKLPGRIGSRTDGGFTLLEVLAAVAILGMLFSVLAGVAVTGLRAEGINLRRIRASLVADNLLSELEAQMLAGVYPEESSEQSEHKESLTQFTIQVDVKPLADDGGGGGGDMVAFLVTRSRT